MPRDYHPIKVRKTLKEPNRSPINNPISSLKSVMATMMNAYDIYHISKSKRDYDRTIGIPTVIAPHGSEKEIETTDFNITQEGSRAWFENGVKVAKDFLARWEFGEWRERCR